MDRGHMDRCGLSGCLTCSPGKGTQERGGQRAGCYPVVPWNEQAGYNPERGVYQSEVAGWVDEWSWIHLSIETRKNPQPARTLTKSFAWTFAGLCDCVHVIVPLCCRLLVLCS